MYTVSTAGSVRLFFFLDTSLALSCDEDCVLIAEGTVADFVFSSLSTLSLTGVEDLLSGPPGGGVSGSSVKLLRFIFLFFLSKKKCRIYIATNLI